jgi:hypothetical protein
MVLPGVGLQEGQAMGIKGFTPATWRGTTAVNPATRGEIGVSFDTPDGVVRLILPIDSARAAAETILDYLELNLSSPTNQRPLAEIIGQPEIGGVDA